MLISANFYGTYVMYYVKKEKTVISQSSYTDQKATITQI